MAGERPLVSSAALVRLPPDAIEMRQDKAGWVRSWAKFGREILGRREHGARTDDSTDEPEAWNMMTIYQCCTLCTSSRNRFDVAIG